MLLSANIILLLCLACITVQDLKHRAISWYFLPLILGALIFRALQTGDAGIFLKDSLLNLGFVFLQLALLTVFMSLRNRKLVNIVNTHLGIGDILFFVVICCAFSFLNFIAFYLIALIFSLLAVVTWSVLSKKAIREIPLAGTMSIALIILVVTGIFFPGELFYNDSHLLNLLTI